MNRPAFSTLVSSRLLAFEAVAVELQRTAVLGYGTHDVIGRAVGNLGIDLQGHRHVRPHESGQMGDYLVGDPARVAPGAGRIE